MARPKSKMNQKPSEFIEQNILKENPEGLPDVVDGLPDENTGLVVAKHIPEMEKIIFLNGRDPGYTLYFHYHSKTHPLKQYTLHHGFEYHLPVEIIDHLESCSEKQYAYRKDRFGDPEMYVKGQNYIFQCKRAKRAA